jgi:uncharacterized protein YcaQ
VLRLTPSAARALFLHAQGLEPRPRGRATKADVLAVIRRMGVLQIDTIHVVARSPYLVLWSRLGDYKPEWLDALLAERALFEYWAHEACFVPAEDYPHFRHLMIDPGGLGWKYSHDWVEQNRALVNAVRSRIREEGPLRSSDFERQDGRKGGWWGWKPEKRALEMLFSAGELMVARRENFQRIYDLRERVRPDWNDALMPPIAETRRALVLNVVRALGVTPASWVADYYRTSRRETPGLVRALAEQGALEIVDVEGWPGPAYIHPELRDLAEDAAAGKLRATRTRLLSPFDPLVWDRARARTMFGFDYALECYTPSPKRRWGYFVLPILRRGRLVGRVDAKAHRRDGRMEMHVVYLEEGVRPSGALLQDLARTFRAFARWHGTPEVIVRRTVPAAWRRELTVALR